jgi:hypothetical protein
VSPLSPRSGEKGEDEWRQYREPRLEALKDSNARAGAFYRRIGFVPTGVEVAYPPNPAFSEHELEYRAAPVG